MRRIAVGLLIVGLVGAFAARAGAATSSQSVSGPATGTFSEGFIPGESHTDTGTYHSLSQLGNGRYDFSTTATAPCLVGTEQPWSGTATLARDDGAVLHGTVVGRRDCSAGLDGALTFTLTLTSGTRDLVGAQLRFVGRLANVHIVPDGEAGDESFTIGGALTTTARVGWWTLGQDGSVYAFGGAPYLGRATTPTVRAVALAPTNDGRGYWIVNALGQVYAFGATWYGNADRSTWVASEHAVGIVPTALSNGYWIVTSAGRVVPFGAAAPNVGQFFPRSLAAPIVAAMPGPGNNGYWLVAADGGVFAYGSARFHGSTGALRLNRPIIGAAASADGAGYWLIASDGGVFAFDVPFRGSLGGVAISDPIVAASAYGNGYLLTSSTGDAFDFSANPFFGWAATNALTAPPIAGIAGLG